MCNFSLHLQCTFLPFSKEILESCSGFSCGDDELDNFFHNGCRFIVVDAYNNGKTTKFYEHNDFRYLYDNELEERSQYNIPPTNKISTRLMYYDLKL